MAKAKWTRRFPGFGRSANLKVLFFPLYNEVYSAFREYDSFLKVGYDSEIEKD